MVSSMVRRLYWALIKDHPRPYRLFLWLRGKRYALPDRTTDLHITGYPRCATTLTLYYFHFLMFPTKQISSHGHSVADLKAALRHDVDTIVNLRNPTDAAASLAVQGLTKDRVDHHEGFIGGLLNRLKATTIEEFARYAIDYYVHYYRFVRNHAEGFHLADFDDVTEEPVEFVARVREKLTMDVPLNRELIERAEGEYRRRKQEVDEVPSAMSGLPDPQKEAKKEDVQDLLAGTSTLEEARDLYRALRTRTV